MQSKNEIQESIETILSAFPENIKADKLIIRDNAEYESLAGLLKTLKKGLDELDERRKRATKPIDDSKKEIMSWFKPAVDFITSRISMLNEALFEYRKRESEKAKVLMEQAIKNNENIVVAPVIPKADIKVRKNYSFMIIDESKVKDEYWIIDEKKIGEIVRNKKELAKDIIGGIEIVITETSF